MQTSWGVLKAPEIIHQINYFIQDIYVAWFDVRRQERQFDVFNASYSQTRLDVESCVHNLSSILVTGQKLQRFTSSRSGWRLPQSQLAKQNVSRGQVSESQIQFLYHFFFEQLNSKFESRQKWIKFNTCTPKFSSNNHSIKKDLYRAFSFSPTFSKDRYFLNLWNLADNMF